MIPFIDIEAIGLINILFMIYPVIKNSFFRPVSFAFVNFRPQITKIAFEGKMFIVHVTISEVS